MGETVVEHFLGSLLLEEQYIKYFLLNDEPLIMSKETQKLSHGADCCHICDQPFKDKIKKVRDHYHIGVERG